ncbi:type IV prepilin peptidase [Deferribacter desulfuricans SSM1]|uniref:Prepilin leader peptidase/N-methyltransferase n=1 Tax=Deferribacter desulfuricans (strain DSM 14783 / JCM 11476 / NBRC 101012 / SSM1) TaxID=639282 RepID=D3PAK1_DEFDS|nr:A24 family peptidase [Deferribacter desulfuricans]BAI79624.1 type IV prepilin peptidase [Deferribacter desulfuricans SSM1]
MDYLFFFILGLIFGSFFNVVISRLPYGKSIISPGSSCPKCGSKIKWYDNIPVISYLLLRGKCRVCGVKISIQYPLVEIITAIITVGLYYKFGLNVYFVQYFVLISLLICAGIIDLITALDNDFETGIIPDEISLGGIPVGIIFGILQKKLIISLIGGLVGFLLLFIPGFVYKLFTGKEGMGGGDIKLFAMIGTFLGYKPLFFILFLSSFVGATIGLFFIYLFKNREYPIPFGPFIGLATIIYIFFGDYIIQTYLKMIA